MRWTRRWVGELAAQGGRAACAPRPLLQPGPALHEPGGTLSQPPPRAHYLTLGAPSGWTGLSSQNQGSCCCIYCPRSPSIWPQGENRGGWWGSACSQASRRFCWPATWRRTGGWSSGMSGRPVPPPSLALAWKSCSCSWGAKGQSQPLSGGSPAACSEEGPKLSLDLNNPQGKNKLIK